MWNARCLFLLSVVALSFSQTERITEGGRFLVNSLPAGIYTIVISDHPKLGCVLARLVIRVTAGTPLDVVIRVPSLSR
jgi:hypothetical protein